MKIKKYFLILSLSLIIPVNLTLCNNRDASLFCHDQTPSRKVFAKLGCYLLFELKVSYKGFILFSINRISRQSGFEINWQYIMLRGTSLKEK
jgi:hypothetical protein